MTVPIVCELTREAIEARRGGLLPGLAARAREFLAALLDS
jgi:hypothetical protein